MRFDMSRAWNDAVAMVSANREVVLIVAGVFFLLPSLVFSFLFADIQANLMADIQKFSTGEMAGTALADSIPASAVAISLVLLLVQMVGYMALLALLDERRPTVGEALVIGTKSLPTLLGAMILFFLGYMVVTVLFGVIVGAVSALLNSTALAFVLLLVLLAVIFYVMIKLSVTLPVIVFERQLNPIAALARSWRLTRGNSFRLFAFYLLLFLVYLVISIIISGILITLLGGVMGGGTVGMTIVALISGLLAVAVNMVFAGVLTGVYRQLAGPSTAGLNQTFG